MIGKQVLAFAQMKNWEFIKIRIFAALSGGRKGRRCIGRFMLDRERSHVCSSVESAEDRDTKLTFLVRARD